MAADGSIYIDTKIDTKGVDEGTKKINGDLAGFSKLAKVGWAAAGAAAVAGGKKIVDALNDCQAAYKKQEKADIALTQAAKNNPYLTGESVSNLKQFASQIEDTAEIADSETVSLMAQLASAGRTEEQIEKIISAAADVSAAGTMDYASAVKVLNKTFQGSAGVLDKSIDGIDGLTDAELKSGKAIDVVAKKYAGMAAAATDSTDRLKNAWTNYKESIGSGWDKVTEPIKNFFADILQKMADVKTKANELSGAQGRTDTGKGTAADYQSQIDYYTDLQKKVQDAIKTGQGMVQDAIGNNISADREELAYIINQIERLNIDKGKVSSKEQNAKLELKNAQDKEAAEKKAKEATESATQKILANRDSLEKQKASILATAKAQGKSADDMDVKQQLLNADIDAYASLIAECGVMAKTEGDSRLAQIQAETDALKKMTAAQEETEKLKDAIGNITIEKSPVQEVQEQIDANEKLTDMVKNATDEQIKAATDGTQTREQLEQELADQHEALEKKMTETTKSEAQKQWEAKTESTQKMLEAINNYASQANDIMQQAEQLQTTIITNQEQAKLDELEASYKKGEISEADYEKKKKQIKQDAAKAQYKIDLAAWASQLLSAQANIALGVCTALRSAPAPYNFILAGMTAAAGAVQTGTLIASKPIPPSFATGGVVGGTSYSGDRIQANVNSGEMILNAAQQRALWDIANGRSGSGMSVSINNNASNIVSAAPKIDGNKMQIQIDMRVKESLAKGRYNRSLNAAQSGMSGEMYVI